MNVNEMGMNFAPLWDTCTMSAHSPTQASGAVTLCSKAGLTVLVGYEACGTVVDCYKNFSYCT